MNFELLETVKNLTSNDKKSLAEKGIKMNEEVGEMARNILAYTSASGSFHKFATTEMLVEDCADIMLVALSIMYDLGAKWEDVEAAMHKKSSYWSMLQEEETKINNDLLPFEIHVTVDYHYSIGFMDKFSKACQSIGPYIKPIHLHLHNKNGVVDDVMTSSTYRGTSQGAVNMANRIAKNLTESGFNVNRVKVETFPSHPNSPKTTNNNMFAAGNYFEAHYEIVTDEHSDKTFKHLVEWSRTCGVKLHISSNVAKSQNSPRITMLTLRSSQSRMEQFKRDVERTLELIIGGGFTVIGKPLVEYAILDTNVTHDVEWLHEH